MTSIDPNRTSTRADFDAFLSEYGAEVEKSFQETPDESMRLMKFIDFNVAQMLWRTGSFIQYVFDELDLPEEDMRRVQFAAGQRSFMKEPEAMIDIMLGVLNAYIEYGVDPKPGRELADQINEELFGAEEP